MYRYYLFLLALGLFSQCSPPQTNDEQTNDQEEQSATPETIPDLISFWDFQTKNGDYLTSSGAHSYTLTEMNGPIKKSTEGVFGNQSLDIERGQWLRILREDCPALNIHGRQHVTVVAWIKRRADVHWQYIAGVWSELDSARQYALFTSGHKQTDYTTLTRTDANHQPHGYVSDVGGATPERPFSFSYATGSTTLDTSQWYMIAYTYNQQSIRVYTDGELDENGNYNPFYWDKPIFDGANRGADFTVAQRAVPSWPDFPEGVPGNKVGFGGLLGGLAVYNRALSAEEIKNLYISTMEK